MPLWVPPGHDNFQWRFSNDSAARPGSALRGRTVSGGLGGGTANTKTAWFEIVTASECAYDVYGVLVNLNGMSSAAVAQDCLVDIGIDPAGGTSYTVLLPNLLASCCPAYNVGFGGHWYYFPIFIPAGSSIGARSQGNVAGFPGSSDTPFAFVTLFGKPRDLSLVKFGTYCLDLGTNTAASNGTSITSGGASEGSWTTIATSISKPGFWWQIGFGVNDSTMSAVQYHCDLAIGDGSNKQIVIQDRIVQSTTSEQLSTMLVSRGCGYEISGGQNAYLRYQCSGTADSSLSGIVYMVG